MWHDTTVTAKVWFCLPSCCLLIGVSVWGLVMVWYIGVNVTCLPLLCRLLLGILILFLYFYVCVSECGCTEIILYFPMEISAPSWRWGNMCAVLALVDNKGLRLSYALLVACMRLPSGRITCGPCVV